jgi:hypothetical protein
VRRTKRKIYMRSDHDECWIDHCESWIDHVGRMIGPDGKGNENENDHDE